MKRRGRRHRRFLLLAGALLVCVPLAGCRTSDTADSADSAHPSSSPTATREQQPRKPPEPASTPSPSASIPLTGSGQFTTALEAMEPVGSGTPMRYRVQVENSLDVSPSETAREINAILADKRGWTTSGQAFQLVASEPAELTVKLAAPETVDALCGAAGLDTRGEVNCTVGSTVVVNLKRWLLGSPQFDGSLHDYRALIINHEVGHRLGHGHEGCSGSAKLAPAMMQQIKGLHGCKANAWPYDRTGTYISGPAIP
nr:DUF3152 domain-containing protein [Streptomyces sp. LBL]